MTICCHVATIFKDQNWNPIYKLENPERNKNVEVPDAITQDPIFHQLIDEGSLEVIITVGQRNRLENEPLAGIDATGKRRPVLQEEKPSGKKSGSKSRKAESTPAETEAKSADAVEPVEE